jgi:hypothetical protein
VRGDTEVEVLCAPGFGLLPPKPGLPAAGPSPGGRPPTEIRRGYSTLSKSLSEDAVSSAGERAGAIAGGACAPPLQPGILDPLWPEQKTRRSPSTARRIPERRALIPNDRLTCDRADHISERGSTPKFDAPKQRLHRRRNPQSGASGRDERAKESSAIKAIVFGEISGGRWVSSGSRSDFPTHSMCWRP